MKSENGEKHSQMPEKHPESTARKIVKMVLGDLILLGIVLCVFAFFHHVLPRWGDRIFRNSTVSQQAGVKAPAVIQESAAMPEPDAVPESSENGEDDLRTPWQIRFEDKFTDEVVSTENSYSSPDVCITINTFSGEYNGHLQAYHVADIYIGQISNFSTYSAHNGFTRYAGEDIVDLDKASDAILSVNGDFCNVQESGYFVRNGEEFLADTGRSANDICVLYYDGTMETYGPKDYEIEDIRAGNPYQIWKFGPELLDKNGRARKKFNTTWALLSDNPRTGIGYYEPGHYCMVVADGRLDGWSRGLTMDEFAHLFEDLGCVSAYNLDGGASSVMSFNDALYSRQCSYREVGDTLFIREIPAEEKEAEHETSE